MDDFDLAESMREAGIPYDDYEWEVGQQVNEELARYVARCLAIIKMAGVDSELPDQPTDREFDTATYITARSKTGGPPVSALVERLGQKDKPADKLGESLEEATGSLMLRSGYKSIGRPASRCIIGYYMFTPIVVSKCLATIEEAQRR